MKWSNEVINTLIDAYKEESCLYAVNSANYHNKHLRSEALKRVGDMVRVLRPEITDKDCTIKIHNLRSPYNIENSKVKASITSGTGTDNIYKPSLWYYEHLKFLDAFFTPRKSRNSVKVKDDKIGEETVTQLEDSQVSNLIVSEGFSQNDTLQVFVEEEFEETVLQSSASEFVSSVPSTSSAAAPMTSKSSSSAANITRPSLPLSPANSTISSGESNRPCPTKLKAPNEENYVDPIVVTNTTNDNTSVTPPVEDGIGAFLT